MEGEYIKHVMEVF